MQIVNVLAQLQETTIDREVGIAIVPGVAEPGVSIGLAVVHDRIRPHYQKVSDEIYYILEGRGDLTVGEEIRSLTKGDTAAIPKGKVHGFINTGDEPCLILFSSGPKFDPETDRFFPEFE